MFGIGLNEMNGLRAWPPVIFRILLMPMAVLCRMTVIGANLIMKIIINTRISKADAICFWPSATEYPSKTEALRFK